MENITVKDLQRALKAKDPGLPDMVLQLANIVDPVDSQPEREGIFTFEQYLREINSYEFKKKKPKDKEYYRREQIKILENGEAKLPERWKIHEVLMELWRADDCYGRTCLLQIIAEIPLMWGAWRALKQIFKEAEAGNDSEMFGALAARFDREWSLRRKYISIGGKYVKREVSNNTLGYLCRRAWRYLRRTAESLPACYADRAADILRFYPNDTRFHKTWIVNHITHHNGLKYTRTKFRRDYRKRDMLKYRAYPELWQRSPRPLFSLLENCQSNYVRTFAVNALKSDFPSVLREVESIWVVRLLSSKIEVIDEFVVWLLGNVPKFEQGAFRDLGLHESVLKMLDSQSQQARRYAADYARAYARDISLNQLIKLVDNNDEYVRKLALDLIGERDPRKEIGLEGWGRLLETNHGDKLAQTMLRKHFGPREMTGVWFKQRLLTPSSFPFASRYLLEIHPLKTLSPDYFYRLFDDYRLNHQSATFALKSLEGFKFDDLSIDFIKEALLHPLATLCVRKWLIEEKIKPEKLGADYLKMLAYHITWQEHPWAENLKKDKEWAKELAYNEELGEMARNWLEDVRKFSATDLEFDWLMQMVKRSEPHYHEFAVEYMIKAFVPADFAATKKEKKEDAAEQGEINIDLESKTFVFTGKLKTMTRKEAQQKVTDANGKNATGVTGKLDYLVIGDEGSALYGQGRKGSKQVKAEKLNGDGAKIIIISETAFLQMLAGKQASFDEGDSLSGCEQLWKMALDSESASLNSFALRYLKRHHPEISLAETDRPVDPGAEIPETFISFERFFPLFTNPRAEIRLFAIDFATWELGRWQPAIAKIVEICECPYPEVKDFFRRALLAPEGREHRRYRIDPANLTVEAVYRFCESLDDNTRALGMKLIERDPKLAVPEELFRLTESPDRKILSFVIHTLWKLYRNRGITCHWRPAKAEEQMIVSEKELSVEVESLAMFMRRMLYRIPPAKFARQEVEINYLTARKVKINLVETMRDLALNDSQFARVITPVFKEFMASQGQSEKMSCVLALTRIADRHPDIEIWDENLNCVKNNFEVRKVNL